MDGTLTIEGSNNSGVNMLNKEFTRSLCKSLENYWVSRTLVMAGVVLMFILPWYITLVVLVVDMVLQNPAPLKPRDTVMSLLYNGRMYWQHYNKRNLKKPE